MKILFAFFISFSFAFSALAAEDSPRLEVCPLGVNENHLTIQRVMLNFGKYVSVADAVALKSLRPNETIEDAEIKHAISQLGLAILCAERATDGPTGDLIPGHIQMITEPTARQEKLDDFVYFMSDFRDGLVEYRDLFLRLLREKSEERNFQSLVEKMNDINHRVDRAHTKLFN